MKRSITVVFVILTAAILGLAQNSAAEQEVLKFNAAYEKAQIDRDVAFFERVFAEDYTFSGPTAEVEDKAKALAYIRSEREKPTYKLVSVKSENVKAKVIGNMAILTGDWIGTGMSATDAQAEPHTDRGRYTAFLEKRNGQWIMLAEHVSEAPHDRKLMEAQVLKIGKDAANMYKNRDHSGFARILADDAVFVNTVGKVRTKADVLGELQNSEYKIELVEITDQKVRVIGNGAAIETGLIRYKGTDKSGKQFDEKERYTTTWVWRGGRWQIAADHTSVIK